MSISSTANPSAATTTSAAAQASSSSTGQQIGEEFNSFIKLLTTQVQNQDPLAPMDSTQFVEQLATFSTLEQQVRSNNSLESIASMIGDLHAMLASEWIGQEVTVESNWVPYSGDAVRYTFDAPTNADSALLTIKDSAGNIVRTEALNPGDAVYNWDGKSQNGEQAAKDTVYQFAIELFDGDELLGTVPPRVVTRVTDLSTENGKLMLGTETYLTTDLASVRKFSD